MSRRTTLALAVVTLGAALAACSPSREGPSTMTATTPPAAAQQESEQPSEPPTSAPAPSNGECAYTPTGQQAAKPVEVPAQPTSRTGTAAVTLQTNNGPIGLTLDLAAAPCTANSFVHLARSKFYDGSPCHRLVASETFRILQCGDPTGQGNGGPGYNIPDELPTTLAPAPSGGASVYPRGVIAMANTGQPNSGGSQFFLVFGDTFLPPDYTIFGTIDQGGLAVLDTIGAAGDDGSLDGGPGGGAPALATTITAAVAS
ncbi:MAG TPA: peptidylprolyl isomerase [Pseudonocardiaceae bacterium]